MAFIQVIEVSTAHADKMMELDAEYEKATAGKSTVRRTIVGRDHSNPNRHFIFAFFDSYESAMENSNLPETGEFAAKWAELADGPPTFIDLDVIEDKTT